MRVSFCSAQTPSVEGCMRIAYQYCVQPIQLSSHPSRGVFLFCPHSSLWVNGSRYVHMREKETPDGRRCGRLFLFPALPITSHPHDLPSRTITALHPQIVDPPPPAALIGLIDSTIRMSHPHNVPSPNRMVLPSVPRSWYTALIQQSQRQISPQFRLQLYLHIQIQLQPQSQLLSISLPSLPPSLLFPTSQSSDRLAYLISRASNGILCLIHRARRSFAYFVKRI